MIPAASEPEYSRDVRANYQQRRIRRDEYPEEQSQDRRAFDRKRLVRKRKTPRPIASISPCRVKTKPSWCH